MNVKHFKCSEEGLPQLNSLLMLFKCITLRLQTIDSNNIKIHINKDMNLIHLPRELKECIKRNSSKKSPYRRGIPFIPIK